MLFRAAKKKVQGQDLALATVKQQFLVLKSAPLWCLEIFCFYAHQKKAPKRCLPRTPKLQQISCDFCKTCHFTVGKTTLFHATFTTTMRLLGFGFHARSTFMREKCAKCSKGNKTQFLIFSHLFTPFSHFVRAFFTLVCRNETKHVKTVSDFSNVELRHFS